MVLWLTLVDQSEPVAEPYVMDKYPSKSYPGQNMRAAAIIRDYMFACDARRFARAGGVPARAGAIIISRA